MGNYLYYEDNPEPVEEKIQTIEVVPNRVDTIITDERTTESANIESSMVLELNTMKLTNEGNSNKMENVDVPLVVSESVTINAKDDKTQSEVIEEKFKNYAKRGRAKSTREEELETKQPVTIQIEEMKLDEPSKAVELQRSKRRKISFERAPTIPINYDVVEIIDENSYGSLTKEQALSQPRRSFRINTPKKDEKKSCDINQLERSGNISF